MLTMRGIERFAPFKTFKLIVGPFQMFQWFDTLTMNGF
jgi:hypothetical protein